MGEGLTFYHDARAFRRIGGDSGCRRDFEDKKFTSEAWKILDIRIVDVVNLGGCLLCSKTVEMHSDNTLTRVVFLGSLCNPSPPTGP